MKTSARIWLLAVVLAGCGSVTAADPPVDGGSGGSAATGGAPGTGGTGTGGVAPTGSGGHGTAGALGTGGSSGACGGADLQTDPNNCGVCGNICPPAEQNKPNDSQQTCYQGNCYVPSGDVCMTNAECITGYCQHNQGTTNPGLCNPPSCTVGSACPSALPNCDDPSNGYARCTTASANGCLCSAL